MSSRTLLCATAVATIALTLTACDPSGGSTDGSNAAGSPVATASAGAGGSTAQTGPPAGTASATGKPAAGKSATPCDPVPTLPAGTKVVNLTKPATSTTLYAQDGVPGCNEVDIYWVWEGSGAEKSFTIAPNAKIQLSSGGGGEGKSATLQQFVTHTQKCETGGTDPAFQCVRKGTAYKITQDASGKITKIAEIFQS